MGAKQLMLQGKIVKKSNALARAKWSPNSVWEPRLVALLASQIKPSDTDFQTYEIRISDLIDDKHGGKDYKEIESAVDKAISRVITIRNGEDWKKYTMFSSCEFNSKKGTLKIGFHPDLKEHYLQLKQYMQYNILEFMLLPSIYSQRIYEFLKSWDDKKETIINVSDLHEMLNTPKSFRNRYVDFKRFVLEKAHKDILKHTDLNYSWEPIKKGRAVEAIRFIFSKKSNKEKSSTQKMSKLLQETLGINSTQENSKKSNHAAFIAKFPNSKYDVIQVGKIWFELDNIGKAPLAKDVPINNELNIIDFLEKWKKIHL